MNHKPTLEMKLEVWNNDTSEPVVVCEDADGLELTDIRQLDKDGNIQARITLTDEMVPLVIQALQRYQVFKIEKKGLEKS